MTLTLAISFTFKLLYRQLFRGEPYQLRISPRLTTSIFHNRPVISMAGIAHNHNHANYQARLDYIQQLLVNHLGLL
jgi:hypothetical protein